jgi:hypothetical protein
MVLTRCSPGGPNSRVAGMDGYGIAEVRDSRLTLRHQPPEGDCTMLWWLLMLILLVLLIGSLPTYPYSRGWGYAPSGILGVLLIIVLILLLMGRI